MFAFGAALGQFCGGRYAEAPDAAPSGLAEPFSARPMRGSPWPTQTPAREGIARPAQPAVRLARERLGSRRKIWHELSPRLVGAESTFCPAFVPTKLVRTKLVLVVVTLSTDIGNDSRLCSRA